MNRQLFPLLQSFGLLAPTDRILWPSGSSLEIIQHFLIEHILDSAHFARYSPSKNYQRKFWKWAIEHIEELGEEVDERIYERYCDLLSDDVGSESRPPAPSYVTYIWHSTKIAQEPTETCVVEQYQLCTLYESRTLIESGTTGLTTWNASFVLADYLSSRPELISNSKVLELGSGAGFLGAIVGHMQMYSRNAQDIERKVTVDCTESSSLYLTDANEQVLVRCRDNVMLACNRSSSHPSLKFKLLDWTDALDTDRRHLLEQFLRDANPDLIIGADLVYDTTIIPPLVAVLKLVLELPYSGTGPYARKAIIAGTVRKAETLDEFIRQCKVFARVDEEQVFDDNGEFVALSLKTVFRHSEHGRVRIFVISRR